MSWDFSNWSLLTPVLFRFVHFWGRLDGSHLFCLLFFWWINTCHDSHMWNMDYVNIPIFDNYIGGHYTLQHGNDYTWRNISCCGFEHLFRDTGEGRIVMHLSLGITENKVNLQIQENLVFCSNHQNHTTSSNYHQGIIQILSDFAQSGKRANQRVDYHIVLHCQ